MTESPVTACRGSEFLTVFFIEAMTNWRNYIHSDPTILLGKPTLKGTRISVELILELLENGWTEAAILEAYPHLTQASIRAVFAYLRECVGEELYFPLEMAP